MTVAGLVTALAVGLTVAALSRLVVPGSRRVPLWLVLVVGVVAAVSGTVLARIAGVEAGPADLLGLGVPAGSAGLGALLVAATAGSRQSPPG
ncbi:GlsB/YeaQ/YmgE family stress response membrane protein [Micromonospora deserti]|uniref:GlsB/YeaQ/YmgE family stress response membrane protein n=1 Tax=Micromonospora deserti TaxID=2070366 RepID=A0A2W2DPP7_9ACTN|nr:GlsB/YeaQ/YmgE family stress response membrane protein [Micromonospora deserti]PZF94743.1 GlsB/YeaQ/YmgE family stress response membrane protein [Micromonospora deserti]